MTIFQAITILILLAIIYILYTRKVWFYRDPNHSGIVQDDGVLLSPVYGIVAYVKRVENGIVVSEKKGDVIHIEEITKVDWPDEVEAGTGWLIGIAMTTLDVHFQYSPLPCNVQSFEHYQTGKNLPMFDLWEYIQITWFRRFVQLWCKAYLLENERQTFWLNGKRVKVALILIADKFVDKITTFVGFGDSVSAGDKLSFISRGSQVDLLVCGCDNLEVLVKPGDRAFGPLTKIARLPEVP